MISGPNALALTTSAISQEETYEYPPPISSLSICPINRWLSFFVMNIYGPEYLRIRPAFYTTDPSGAAGIAEAAPGLREEFAKIIGSE